MIPKIDQYNIVQKFTKMTVAPELTEEDIKELKKLKHKVACKKYYEKNKEKVIKHQLEFNKEYVKKEVNCDTHVEWKILKMESMWIREIAID